MREVDLMEWIIPQLQNMVVILDENNATLRLLDSVILLPSQRGDLRFQSVPC